MIVVERIYTIDYIIVLILCLVLVAILFGMRWLRRPRGVGAASPSPPDSVTRSAYSVGDIEGEGEDVVIAFQGDGDSEGMERYDEKMMIETAEDDE